jgi:hypothetical protein
MQFFQVGNFYGVSLISGPQHNLLQVRFGPHSLGKPGCEQLPAVGDRAVRQPLDENALITHVLNGAADANAQLGTSFYIAHIRYVQNDTKPESVYRHLSKELIKHVAANSTEWRMKS